MFWWLVMLYCTFKLLLWYFYFFLTKPEGKLSIEKKNVYFVDESGGPLAQQSELLF